MIQNRFRSFRFFRKIREVMDFLRPMEIPASAAHTGFFVVLSAFPALVLLLVLMHNTFLDVEDLMQMAEGIIPGALLPFVRKIVINTDSHSTGSIVSLSLLTALWSASNGIYALQNGMNKVYNCPPRSYLRKKLICMGYTFLLLIVMILTLVLHVFGNTLLNMLYKLRIPLVGWLTSVIDFRFLLLLVLQSLLFAAMYTVIPNQKNKFAASVPGALLAAIGWLVFADVFSMYVERFPRFSYIYGSVYAIALCMLWLYFCISIIFYGGALNAWLARKNRSVSEP